MSHDHLIEMCEACDEFQCEVCDHGQTFPCAFGEDDSGECPNFQCNRVPDTCYTDRAIGAAESRCDR